MKKILTNLLLGETATITKILEDTPTTRRLMEIGFIKGRKVKMVRMSPNKKIYVVELLDYQIEIRKNILKLIEVESE